MTSRMAALDTSEQPIANGNREDPASRDDAIAGSNAGGVAEWHREQPPVAEPDHLDRQRRASVAAAQLAHFAHSRARTDRFDHQSDHADHAAADRRGLDVAQTIDVRSE